MPCKEICNESSWKLIQGHSDSFSMACSMTIFHDNLCEVRGKQFVLETDLEKMVVSHLALCQRIKNLSVNFYRTIQYLSTDINYSVMF